MVVVANLLAHGARENGETNMARRSGRTSAPTHNGAAQFVQKFKVPFSLEPAFVDIKDMSLNYKDGLIPIQDIADAVTAVTASWKGRIHPMQQLISLMPKFGHFPVSKICTHPAFNRDTSPNHCLKLERDWIEQYAHVSLGVKMPDVYDGFMLLADSTHTSVNKVRRGDAELPVWYAEVPDQGNYESTLKKALYLAGHMFLKINVINKRGTDIFDRHYIQTQCNIYPSPQIDRVVTSAGCSVKRAGARIPYAVHNLNETYACFGLDEKTSTPGRLLKRALEWHRRNFVHQSIDGCLMISFAMVVHDNEKEGIEWSIEQEDKVASLLKSKWRLAREIQLGLKKEIVLPPGSASLDNNYIVSSGIKNIVLESSDIPCSYQSLDWKKD